MGTAISSYFAVEARSQADKALHLADEKSALAESEQLERQRAEHAQRKAEKSATEAREAHRMTARHLYDAQINLAQQAYEGKNIGRVLQLLESTRPEHAGGEDLPSFEWHYLWRLCHADLRTIEIGQYAHAAAFSPDGRMAATSGKERVQIWNTDNGQLVRSLPTDKVVRRALAFSPDGKLLASGDENHLVQIWDVETGKLLQTLTGHNYSIYSLAFDPQGNRIVSGAGEYKRLQAGQDVGEISLWDVSTGRLIRTFPKQALAIFVVKFSPDGKRFATGDRRGTLRLWDPDRGEETASWKANDSAILTLDFSPDGGRIACGGWNGAVIKVFRIPDGKQVTAFGDGPTIISSVVFHPDGRRLLSGGSDQTVRIWDTTTGEQIQQFRGHNAWVEVAAFRSGTCEIVSVSGLTIKIWDANVTPGITRFPRKVSGIPTTDVAFSPDHRWLVVTEGTQYGHPGAIQIWNLLTGELQESSKEEASLNAIAFSPNGRSLAIAKADGTVTVRDLSSRVAYQFPKYDAAFHSVAWSPNGRWIAAGTEDGRVKVWNASTHELVADLPSRRSLVASLAFSPTGELLAAGAQSGVKVWNISKKNQLVYDFKRVGTIPSQVVFSPNRPMFAYTDGPDVVFCDSGTGRVTQRIRASRLGQRPVFHCRWQTPGNVLWEWKVQNLGCHNRSGTSNVGSGQATGNNRI